MLQFIVLYNGTNKMYYLYQLINNDLVPQGIFNYRSFSVLSYRVYLITDGKKFSIKYKLI